MDAPFQIEPKTGVLKFAQISLTLAPKLPIATFLANAAGASAKDGGSNDGWRRYQLVYDLPDGRVLGVSLFFFDDSLSKVRFDYRAKSECGWSNWSEKRELARIADYEREIVRQLGGRGRFQWGVADAGYDDKAASAVLFVNYT